jgi:hypothetical protein
LSVVTKIATNSLRSFVAVVCKTQSTVQQKHFSKLMLLPNQSLKRDVATADAPRVLNVEFSKYKLRYDRIFKLKNNFHALERCNAA